MDIEHAFFLMTVHDLLLTSVKAAIVISLGLICPMFHKAVMRLSLSFDFLSPPQRITQGGGEGSASLGPCLAPTHFKYIPPILPIEKLGVEKT